MRTTKHERVFERDELIRIVERAKTQAEFTINPMWKRTLEDLAYAAYTLDAYIARSSVVEE